MWVKYRLTISSGAKRQKTGPVDFANAKSANPFDSIVEFDSFTSKPRSRSRLRRALDVQRELLLELEQTPHRYADQLNAILELVAAANNGDPEAQGILQAGAAMALFTGPQIAGLINKRLLKKGVALDLNQATDWAINKDWMIGSPTRFLTILSLSVFRGAAEQNIQFPFVSIQLPDR